MHTHDGAVFEPHHQHTVRRIMLDHRTAPTLMADHTIGLLTLFDPDSATLNPLTFLTDTYYHLIAFLYLLGGINLLVPPVSQHTGVEVGSVFRAYGQRGSSCGSLGQSQQHTELCFSLCNTLMSCHAWMHGPLVLCVLALSCSFEHRDVFTNWQ